ncbi:short chain type dehydrogenase [Apiospora arundinis]|uniref:Short chain type dehydrogenase n=1 Tax=Apiospora arundinis TaxID=335852 RepID=A0ABR2IGW5_9PEZI
METVLIIGAGPGVGLSTARAFQNAGFRVAIASRTRQEKTDPSFRHFVFDAAKPDTVKALFEQVTAALGPPKVVVYNAALCLTAEPEDAFSLDLDQVRESMAVNTISPYAAAREAVNGFEKTGPGSTFIMTGNKLNTVALPRVLCFGMGKSAAAHMIQNASISYKNKGYKFYYADQRQPDGGPTIPVDGEAHAKLYVDLAKDTEQRQWDHTFVDGQGYVEFPTPGQ